MSIELVPFRIPTTFSDALERWRDAAARAANTRMTFEVGHAKAIAESKGTNEAARKADANLATAPLKLEAELADVEAKALHHVVLYLRGADDEADS